MFIYSSTDGNFATAEAFFRAGLNVLPLRVDGSKCPKIRWAQYTVQRLPWYLAQHWFASLGCPSGIAIACGMTSGNLEVIDHDVFWTFTPWAKNVESQFPGLVKSLPIVATPSKGWHIYYRCETVEGRLILSQDEAGEILVETRGQGCIAVAPGSPAATHKLGKPYRLLTGDLLNVPTVTTDQRQAMLDAGRQFNRFVEKPKPQPIASVASRPTNRPTVKRFDSNEDRPGDRFNAEADWADILEPYGWTIASVRAGVTYWRKPNSFGPNHHATTNYAGKDLFYVFSTGIPGFDSNRAYNKFAVFAVLACGGDFSEAARRIRLKDTILEDYVYDK